MTGQELTAIKARHAMIAAPWKVSEVHDASLVVVDSDREFIADVGGHADALFIAHAPDDVAILIAEVERLRAADDKRSRAAVYHDYLSTYCFHGKHAECRLECKVCKVPCRCACHEGDCGV